MESDVIEHLVDVEHTATSLLESAKKEAQKRVEEAKITADKEYQFKYKKMVAALEDDFASKTKVLKTTYLKTIQKYKDQLESSSKDEKGFYSFLDKILFKA